MSFFTLRSRAAILALAALTLAACFPQSPSPEDVEDDTLLEDEAGDIDVNDEEDLDENEDEDGAVEEDDDSDGNVEVEGTIQY